MVAEKEQLAEELRNRIEQSLSRFDNAGKEYDISLGLKNNRRVIIIQRKKYTAISHYVIKILEDILKFYKLELVFYYIEIDLKESKPTIEITIA